MQPNPDQSIRCDLHPDKPVLERDPDAPEYVKRLLDKWGATHHHPSNVRPHERLPCTGRLTARLNGGA